MNENELKNELKNKLDKKTLIRGDLEKLFDLLDQKESKIHQLEQKNQILLQQNMELTQEMESIKSDFGGDLR